MKTLTTEQMFEVLDAALHPHSEGDALGNWFDEAVKRAVNRALALVEEPQQPEPEPEPKAPDRTGQRFQFWDGTVEITGPAVDGVHPVAHNGVRMKHGLSEVYIQRDDCRQVRNVRHHFP